MTNPLEKEDDKSLIHVYTLWFFTGRLGGHRYYLGDYTYAIFMTVTFGGFGVWTIIDTFLMKKRTKWKNAPLENSLIHPRWNNIADKLTFIAIILYSILPLIIPWLYIVIIVELYQSFGMPTVDDIMLYLFIIILSFKIIQLPIYLFFLSIHSKAMRKYPFIIVLLHIGISILLFLLVKKTKADLPLFSNSMYMIASFILLTGLYRFILYLIDARRKEERKKNKY